MPIQINLMAEALAAEDQRRRNPVKRAIYIGALLVALSLVWYSSTWVEQVSLKAQLNQIKNNIETRTKEYNEVQANRKKSAEAQKRLDALQQLSASRLLQGNLMNAVQQVYVPNVQLLRMQVNQTYSQKELPGQKPGTPNKVGSCTERTILLIDAKDTSANPGDQVNKYRDALAKLDYFKTNLNPTNAVRLTGPPQQGTAEGKQFVQFTIECRFNEKTQ
jgi:hypothetical protein